MTIHTGARFASSCGRRVRRLRDRHGDQGWHAGVGPVRRQERRDDHLASTREMDGATRHLRPLRPRHAAAFRAASFVAALRIMRPRDDRMDDCRGWFTSASSCARTQTNRDPPCRMISRSSYSLTIIKITVRCMRSIYRLAVFMSFRVPIVRRRLTSRGSLSRTSSCSNCGCSA